MTSQISLLLLRVKKSSVRAWLDLDYRIHGPHLINYNCTSISYFKHVLICRLEAYSYLTITSLDVKKSPLRELDKISIEILINNWNKILI